MSGAWGTRIEIKSSSSSRVYIVSEKLISGCPTGTWGCSCPGWKSRRNCKHLKTMNLVSCEAPLIPVARGEGHYTVAFTDAAYRHYNVGANGGFGSPDEWFRLAEEMARGRKRYTPPRRSAPNHADDMKLFGFTTMPVDVKDLVSAMRKLARKLHPDLGGSKEAFTAMFMAYERLLTWYPKGSA